MITVKYFLLLLSSIFILNYVSATTIQNPDDDHNLPVSYRKFKMINIKQTESSQPVIPLSYFNIYLTKFLDIIKYLRYLNTLNIDKKKLNDEIDTILNNGIEDLLKINKENLNEDMKEGFYKDDKKHGIKDEPLITVVLSKGNNNDITKENNYAVEIAKNATNMIDELEKQILQSRERLENKHKTKRYKKKKHTTQVKMLTTTTHPKDYHNNKEVLDVLKKEDLESKTNKQTTSKNKGSTKKAPKNKITKKKVNKKKLTTQFRMSTTTAYPEDHHGVTFKNEKVDMEITKNATKIMNEIEEHILKKEKEKLQKRTTKTDKKKEKKKPKIKKPIKKAEKPKKAREPKKAEGPEEDEEPNDDSYPMENPKLFLGDVILGRGQAHDLIKEIEKEAKEKHVDISDINTELSK